MAIQIPNPGTGNGATGDNEFVLWSKVRDNFSDQNNAASRLVGTAAGQIPLAQDTKKASLSKVAIDKRGALNFNLNNMEAGDYVWIDSAHETSPYELLGSGIMCVVNIASHLEGRYYQIATSPDRSKGLNQAIRGNFSSGADDWTDWAVYYTTNNTTKDANGFIKAASPIVKVHADKVVLNGGAEQQNITFKKNGIGDYTIETVTGLSTDGWYIELPKDINGNPKVAVTLTETDGVISLKCYKRVFSMETFTFVPDLDEPLDVPDGRWIDLRLNEIPDDDINPDEV